MDDAGCWELPTDVLVEILQRLPPSSRRRFRLVCRHWRDVVDDRTTEMESRAKVLFWNFHDSVAYVVDDLSPSSTGSCTELWSRADGSDSGLQLVATCNGLLCLCDNAKLPGGAITLVNPATGESLPIPPLPCAGVFNGIPGWQWWDQAYTLAYHPISGQYKVVHVPISFDEGCEFDTVQVLTLGQASWREVPAGAEGEARCHRNAGIISVDGTTYWTTEDSAARVVVSFDLEHERVTSITLPPLPETSSYYRLTEVQGRLGIVVDLGNVSLTTEVWVLEKGRRWSRWYSLRQHLPRPHFVYGEYVLALEESMYACCTRKSPSLSSGVGRVIHQNRRTLIADNTFGYHCAHYPSGTFAYVETREPLSVYAAN